MSESWTWLVVPELFRIEWIYLGALIFLSCLLPRRSSMLNSIDRVLHRLANRRRAAVLATVLVVLLGRLALMGSLGIPRPAIHDEFGFLLTADTFAHGRMANPTPPLWKPLQTMHIFFTPTYQSQYPIGYPAVLAAAQVAFKNPWWAVYLTTALMCGAITWMLQAWMPPYWALLGGLFVAIRLGLFSYWMNSFWGGSLTALGGALVFGALPRVTKRFGRARLFHADPILGASLLLALGLAILASTRPFEGFVVCLPAAAAFLGWLLSQRGDSLRHAVWHALVPGVVVLSLTAGITLYYQHRVTGHALESPYHVALKQLHVTQPFVFQKPLPAPHYDNLEMRLLYVHYAAELAAKMHTPYGFLETLKDRLTWYWQFFVGPLMTLPLLGCVLALRERRLRVAWLTVFLLAVAVLAENWIQVHYLAPALCLFTLLLLEGARRLKALHLGRYAVGARIVRILPIVCVLLLGLRIFAFSESDESEATHWPFNWAYSTERLHHREQVEDILRATPGQHLVLVRYRYPFHNFHHEWVFNGADPAGSKVLWARSMDAKQNCAFVWAYGGRRLWTVDEWGDVTEFLPATDEQICDPSNRIYSPNRSFEYYTKRRALSAGLH
jgi:hypothetical protein